VTDDLHPYPLTRHTVHLCVDMQRLFSTEGPWRTPWMDRVLRLVTELAARHPERTVFTRFIPPERATDMPGMWRRYYTRWKAATREHLNPALLELLPPLAKSAGNRDRQNKVLRVYRIPACRTSAHQRSGWTDFDWIRNRRLRACNGPWRMPS
jgi:nicotinamidase-related amidase